MKDKILSLLKKNNFDYVSGEMISKELNITRSAIWKYMKALKEDGYKIDSVTNKGYLLLSSPDVITYGEICNSLTTKYIGRNYNYFSTIDSTSTKAKDLASKNYPEGTTIISELQTCGRGRMGRTWVSPSGKGLFFSIILRPNVDPYSVGILTFVAAAAIHKSLKSFNIDTTIKWPNDIYLDNKKVCGILTELNCELSSVNYVVLGIGLNVNTTLEDYPSDIQTVATSLKIHCGQNISRQLLLASILNNFEDLYEKYKNNDITEALSICRNYSNVIGKEIYLINKNSHEKVLAKNINDDGSLLVIDANNKERTIYSGEISVRPVH